MVFSVSYHFLFNYHMKAPLVLLALLLTLSSCSLSERYNAFQAYKGEWDKKYDSTAIQIYRFAIYVKNMLMIEEMNANPLDDAVYGESMFTDLTENQMRQMVGMVEVKSLTFDFGTNQNQNLYTPKKGASPDSWNWTSKGVVGPIRNQGSCGSCWTFSTVGNIESLNYMRDTSQNKQFIPYSQTQLIDCDKVNFGCNGGWPYKAIDWLAQHGGLMTEKDYPLRSNYSGPCQFDQKKERLQIKGYQNITHDQEAIKDALYEIGPLSILLDFTGLFHYKSGVANPLWCTSWPDHALVLTGYGKDKEHDYWEIKNSWGPKWGKNGYLWLKRGHNKCGIQLWATTAILA